MEKELIGKIGENVLVHVHLHDQADGTFLAECLEIPGCSVSAPSEQEVTDLIKEAIEACVSMLLKEDAKERKLQIMTA